MKSKVKCFYLMIKGFYFPKTLVTVFMFVSVVKNDFLKLQFGDSVFIISGGRAGYEIQH